MKAYIIVEISITDPALYEEYKKLTPASLVPFEGQFLVRRMVAREDSYS